METNSSRSWSSRTQTYVLHIRSNRCENSERDANRRERKYPPRGKSASLTHLKYSYVECIKRNMEDKRKVYF
uniref:Uncharacterized protein n=1 Tax=Pararge aegeria TaxID=116150 RepID=S4PG87_9NEOP